MRIEARENTQMNAQGTVGPIDVEVRLAVDANDIVGESPVWSAAEQALYWVDIDRAGGALRAHLRALPRVNAHSP